MWIFTFQKAIFKYFFLKGFIGLNGCSLTINRVDRNSHEISVDLIPETLRLTTWASVQVGDSIMKLIR
jgi:riboflavin synthase